MELVREVDALPVYVGGGVGGLLLLLLIIFGLFKVTPPPTPASH